MTNLDDLAEIKKFDTANVYESIKQLPEQCDQAWSESYSLEFPKEYRDIDNIVISGMGGSTYGARIVKSLYERADFTRKTFTLSNNYWLPGYVGPNSLVILSSYSGTTEETLECAKIAKKKKAKIIGITSGGSLADFLNINRYPSYIFRPLYNPCQQPRIGVGYMVLGLIGVLAKLSFIPVSQKEIRELVAFLRDNAVIISKTKQLAVKLENKLPVLIVADFLEGSAYAVQNPLHETAKQFGLYFTIPELNHHLMEGLKFPKTLKEYFLFLFISSEIYDKRNIRRLELTREVVEKNSIATEILNLHGKSALTQSMELIQFGAFLTFYLSVLHRIDPKAIPWVDYFKKKLQQEVKKE